MNALTYVLAGGFAKGYRTYILASVAFITVAAQFSVGDLTLVEFINQASLALGLGTLRASVTAA